MLTLRSGNLWGYKSVTELKPHISVSWFQQAAVCFIYCPKLEVQICTSQRREAANLLLHNLKRIKTVSEREDVWLVSLLQAQLS